MTSPPRCSLKTSRTRARSVCCVCIVGGNTERNREARAARSSPRVPLSCIPSSVVGRQGWHGAPLGLQAHLLKRLARIVAFLGRHCASANRVLPLIARGSCHPTHLLQGRGRRPRAPQLRQQHARQHRFLFFRACEVFLVLVCKEVGTNKRL